MVDEGDVYRQVINNVKIKGLNYVKLFVCGLTGEQKPSFEGAHGKVNFIFIDHQNDFQTYIYNNQTFLL